MIEVLLLGGTGAMGTFLVDILAKSKINCVVTSRSKKNSCNYVTYICGNAKDDKFLFPLLESRHWSSIIDFMSYSTEEFANRFQTLLKCTDQYVYLSSSRVYANSETPLKESSPRLLDSCSDKEYLSTDEYALSKARQENLLLSSCLKNWTIIRPYITFSDARLQLSCLEKEYWLKRVLDNKTIVFSKDLANKTTTFTCGNDVAKGIAAIIGKKEALGEIFHITNNKSYKWADFLQVYTSILEQYCGHKASIIYVDKWSDYYSGKWQIIYDRLYDRTFDNSKINKFIDTSNFIDPKIALSDCLLKFLEQPTFKSLYWETEAKLDSLSGDWTSLSAFPGLKQKIKYFLARLGMYHC